uniref:Uncharacterized protein n=1 Tax=Pithovirus LCPAC302 TaxID=2506593 RepID=A0A481Z6Q2_9VIRU|nr:MAG: hypothetical protein LCPAC302_00670 [Pithovirus LCPAC302]
MDMPIKGSINYQSVDRTTLEDYTENTVKIVIFNPQEDIIIVPTAKLEQKIYKIDT